MVEEHPQQEECPEIDEKKGPDTDPEHGGDLARQWNEREQVLWLQRKQQQEQGSSAPDRALLEHAFALRRGAAKEESDEHRQEPDRKHRNNRAEPEGELARVQRER